MQVGLSGTSPQVPPVKMLFYFTSLLAIFPVVSMKSPIFGPQEVNRMEGSSASITCYYPATSVNQHTRKYWCRQGAKGICMTLISETYISKDYKDRANFTNFPGNNSFVINIANLTKNDSGRYKCGLGINSRGLSFDVNMKVSQDHVLLGDTQIYTADSGRTVTINCTFKPENSQEEKSVCKKTGQDCISIVSSTGYKHPDYKDRADISIKGTSELKFSFILKQLRISDAGMYICQTGSDSRGDKSNVDLQVLKPEPKLAYGDLRGSMKIDCALTPKAENVAKFLCRVNSKGTCDVIINTLGKKAQAFEGRVLLTPNDNLLFSVLITSLRKEDAGHYLCGAHPDGQPHEGWPTQAWYLFINEETTIPLSPSVVKGVVGGSVAVLCPYNSNERNNVKYWCRWKDTQNGNCPLLVQSEGLVQEQYEGYKGRLALYEEPGNGTYTVILNQLTTQDAGFYWCLTNGNNRWMSTVELRIIEGDPNLKAPKNVTAWLGETLNLPCHVPCKFYSYEKYWCKWTNKGCRALPNQDKGPKQAFVNCSQKSQLIDLILNPVTKEDEGWYWCGVKDGLRYKDTTAVYVAVKERVKGSQDVNQMNSAPSDEVIEPRVRESNVVQYPSLIEVDRVDKDTGNPADDNGASTDPGSSVGKGGNSSVLVSTLVALSLMLGLGAVALGVARARHRRNVDRISIRSYRTDISMSDFENSRDFGAKDNVGAFPVNQETCLGGEDEFIATTESAMETEEPNKAKRSSKEEVNMAYTAFLLQSNNIAANSQDDPSKA